MLKAFLSFFSVTEVKGCKDLGGCHIFLMTKMNVISLYVHVPVNCLYHGMDVGQMAGK